MACCVLLCQTKPGDKGPLDSYDVDMKHQPLIASQRALKTSLNFL